MNRNIAYILFFLLFLTMPIQAFSEEIITDGDKKIIFSLNDLYRLSLERSEDIQIAENQLYVAQKDEDRAFSFLVPKLSAFGNYIRYSESSTTQPESGHDYGAKLKQQFTINGKELIVLGAAKDTITQREYDLHAVKENNLYNIASAYYDIVNNTNRVEILEANVNRLETHKEAVLKKLKLEEVPKTDLLRTEAELSGSKAELLRDQNILVYMRSKLSRLVDLPGNYEIAFPENRATSYIEDGLDSFINRALQTRADIQSIKMDIVLAEASIDLEKSDYWPVLSLEAGYKVQETDPSYLSADESLYAAVNLNVILYDWGFRSATIGQEKANKRSAELHLKARIKQVSLEVEQAYLTIITAVSAIEALTDKLKFSRANYDAVSRQFELGQANSLDVMDVNTTLFSAERELSEAQNTLSLAEIGLQRAQGIFLKTVVADIQ